VGSADRDAIIRMHPFASVRLVSILSAILLVDGFVTVNVPLLFERDMRLRSDLHLNNHQKDCCILPLESLELMTKSIESSYISEMGVCCCALLWFSQWRLYIFKHPSRKKYHFSTPSYSSIPSFPFR
jgi:hypothetical protein